MGFLDKKEDKAEMEVIEDQLEAEETKLDKIMKEKEAVIEASTEEEEVEIMVVRKEDIPMQEVRLITKEDGSKVRLVTTEEALSKIMNS